MPSAATRHADAGVEYEGLLAAVSAKIADINTTIKNMDARTAATTRALIDVTWRSRLNTREGDQSLRSVEGVIDVERAGGLEGGRAGGLA